MRRKMLAHTWLLFRTRKKNGLQFRSATSSCQLSADSRIAVCLSAVCGDEIAAPFTLGT